ncbi:MAG: fluoride efflux transporter CrcB [Acidobacteriota bacterium]|nr:fluoride efflux transporter CrcB [Acidobacteriota bacterium]
METFTKILAVAFGGAFGAVARYLLNISPLSNIFQSFPFATFFINVSGSFLIGFLLILLTEKFPASENLRLAIIVGFLGAYTTFSTFEFETFALIREKQLTSAIVYVSLSFALGLIGVLSGVFIARKL